MFHRRTLEVTGHCIIGNYFINFILSSWNPSLLPISYSNSYPINSCRISQMSFYHQCFSWPLSHKITNLVVWWSVLTRCLFSVDLSIRSHDSPEDARLHWDKSRIKYFFQVLYQIGFCPVYHFCELCPTSAINCEWIGDVSSYKIRKTLMFYKHG